MILSMCLFGTARSDEPVYDIDIPAMNAAQALNRFAEQTGAIMLFSYDLASAADRVRATQYPQADEFARQSILKPPSEEEMARVFANVSFELAAGER